VYPLLENIVDHFEEELTPAAMRLLRYVTDKRPNPASHSNGRHGFRIH